jgi:serine/threonine-protein kinase RsbW
LEVLPDGAGGAPGTRPVQIFDQRFDAQTLYQLRSAVAAHTAELGLSANQANDILIAVHELASNTVRHGKGYGRLCAWTDQETLICTVADGEAPGDLTPLPGKGASPAGSDHLPWPAIPGHGLWLVCQLADQFAVRSDEGKVSATVRFTRS